LAERAGVSSLVVRRIERADKGVPVAALEAVQAALEREGVVFLPATAEIGSAIAVKIKSRRGPVHAVRAARAFIGLRQDDLARLTGLSRQTIIRVEQHDWGWVDSMPRKLKTALASEGVVFMAPTADLRFTVGMKNETKKHGSTLRRR
jgi:transcriptional regulator with XRE-family HTH domain